MPDLVSSTKLLGVGGGRGAGAPPSGDALSCDVKKHSLNFRQNYM